MSEQHLSTVHEIPPDMAARLDMAAPSDASAPPDATEARLPDLPGLTRRGFLRVSAVTGVGVAAAAVAACTPGAAWTYPPSAASPIPSGPPATSPAASAAASASPMASHDAGASPNAAPSTVPSGDIPPGWSAHDVEARDKIRRYLGDLVPALKDIYGEAAFLKLADILGAEDDYPALHQKPSFVQVPQLVLSDALKPLTPRVEGGVQIFELTIDAFDQKIDEVLPPIAALGFNGQWPGPTIRVNQGDKVRALFTNNLDETTGVHFHGVEFDDFFQDGVPFVTQKPIVPTTS
jgi:hypothetical protein